MNLIATSTGRQALAASTGGGRRALPLLRVCMAWSALRGVIPSKLPAAVMVGQGRWGSKEAASNGGSKRAEQAAGSGSEEAVLFMDKGKQAHGPAKGDSDRQTVRPPDMPAAAQHTHTQSKAQPQQGAGELAADQAVGPVTQLTDAEEAQLEVMREDQSKIREQLSSVLREQFGAPIRYAFAYGSGVYRQSGYGSGKPMVDLIFGVTHPDHWHALNIGQNRHHYSLMGTLGSNAVSFVQDRMGAGVYYNPFVEVDGMVIKYGVVSMDTLSSDLLNWDTLYLAGRMQKPTLTLRRDPLMRISKQVNLTHAVRAALLQLPKNFTEEELFRAIAALSFSGDFRMKIGGENPRKVHNIVEAQLPLFKSRYGSIIEGLPNLEHIGQGLLQQDMSPKARAAMLRKMPNNFYDRLVRQGRKAGVKLPPGLGAETVNSEKLVQIERIGEATRKAIESIVAWPALTQSAKGVLSSGIAKTVAYVRAKNNKYRASDKN
ncbi:Mitochondrial translocator assembly and maintenance protein 41 [Coemansia sp. RSA 552]|nr:Mitochondrial translocator assembly and maintenance protein 41 [Coemansia sp. RSA 552]